MGSYFGVSFALGLCWGWLPGDGDGCDGLEKGHYLSVQGIGYDGMGSGCDVSEL